ncbi:hypothetical protein ACTI_59900 [Actinoplanes sp. OR16]|uniref:hypothetical protein n=1 Tax=Actinoplanes sp. OR16 TaxID=946334 RepID=UPI000F708B93|nr:hypothetical protein [Actinoplanes sp. OR16]BBH69305.1 hypothetical protein ACTI_59900 [Actinoplanes sp. OR16]
MDAVTFVARQDSGIRAGDIRGAAGPLACEPAKFCGAAGTRASEAVPFAAREEGSGFGRGAVRGAGRGSDLEMVTFAVWDAPGFGVVRLDRVSTQWVGARPDESRLVMVVLGRESGCLDGEEPDLAVSSMDPSIGGDLRRGLVAGALLSLAERAAAAQEISQRESATALMRMAERPGADTTLGVDGRVVPAWRYEVPGSEDWVIVSGDAEVPVCVSGLRGVRVPELEAADLALWREPLLAQIAGIRSGPV